MFKTAQGGKCRYDEKDPKKPTRKGEKRIKLWRLKDPEKKGEFQKLC